MNQPSSADRDLIRQLMQGGGRGVAREPGDEYDGIPADMWVGEVDEDGWVDWRSTELEVAETAWEAATRELPVPLPPLYRAMLTTVSSAETAASWTARTCSSPR